MSLRVYGLRLDLNSLACALGVRLVTKQSVSMRPVASGPLSQRSQVSGRASDAGHGLAGIADVGCARLR